MQLGRHWLDYSSVHPTAFENITESVASLPGFFLPFAALSTLNLRPHSLHAQNQSFLRRKPPPLLRAADRQMSLIVEALLNLSSYLRNEQTLIDARKYDRQIVLPILYDSAGSA
jgi:hypothetical protein